MKDNKFRKYAGIITLLLFLVTFIPSALSSVEGTTGSQASADMDDGTPTGGAGTVGQATQGMTHTAIGAGTIAVGTAIAEAAVMAVAATQSNSSNGTTSH